MNVIMINKEITNGFFFKFFNLNIPLQYTYVDVKISKVLCTLYPLKYEQTVKCSIQRILKTLVNQEKY